MPGAQVRVERQKNRTNAPRHNFDESSQWRAVLPGRSNRFAGASEDVWSLPGRVINLASLFWRSRMIAGPGAVLASSAFGNALRSPLDDVRIGTRQLPRGVTQVLQAWG